MKEKYDKDVGLSKDQAINLTLRIVMILQLVTQVVLRSGPGVDQPGFNAIIVAVGLPIYAHEIHSEMVMNFWKFWLVALCAYRLSMDRSKHSWDPGVPWLMRIITGDARFACLLEGTLVLALGFIIEDRGMAYLMRAAGGATIAHELVIRHVEERQRIAFNNARREADKQSFR